MHDSLKVGSIVALHRYPVKSMMGEEINSTRVGPKGLEGDRVSLLPMRRQERLRVRRTPPSGLASSIFALRSQEFWLIAVLFLRYGLRSPTEALSLPMMPTLRPA